jgi:hypothetical protein
MSSVTMGIGLLLALTVGLGVGLPLGWVAAAGNARELVRWRASNDPTLVAGRHNTDAGGPRRDLAPAVVPRRLDDPGGLARLCAELGEHDWDGGAQLCDCGAPHALRICARCLLVDDTECGPVQRGGVW